jgi:hypothetical protein
MANARIEGAQVAGRGNGFPGGWLDVDRRGQTIPVSVTLELPLRLIRERSDAYVQALDVRVNIRETPFGDGPMPQRQEISCNHLELDFEAFGENIHVAPELVAHHVEPRVKPLQVLARSAKAGAHVLFDACQPVFDTRKSLSYSRDLLFETAVVHPALPAILVSSS